MGSRTTKTTPPSVVINASTFIAATKPLLRFAGDDYIPIINTLRIRVIDGHLVADATDRFKFGIIRRKLDDEINTAAADDFDVILSVDTITQIHTVFGPRRGDVAGTVTLTATADAVTVEQADGFFFDARLSFPQVQGQRPQLDKILADLPALTPKSRADVVGLNPKLIAEFQQVAGRNEPIVLRVPEQLPAGKTGPVIVTTGDHFIGGIMPVRVGGAEAQNLTGWNAFLSGDGSAMAAEGAA